MRLFLKTGALVLALATGAGGALAQDAAPPRVGQITVTGEGVVASAPDMASVSLGVTNVAQTAAQALEANTASMRGVMDRLTAAGIEARDLQTSSLQLHPNWVQTEGMQSAEIQGYTATNMLTARVRDLAILGGVLDAAVQDGANTLNGLNFENSNPKPAQSEARKLNGSRCGRQSQ
ncbi:MAG: SIMPL domain-containing protein [Cypionkella sp.]|nr:SIMPL domain-containing protein [Cypionkella sp.]